MRPNGQDEGGVSGSALTILLTVMFVNMLGLGIIVPLLPFYSERFQAASWQVALIFSAYSVGAFFGEPFWGRMSDRLGRKPTVALACIVAIVVGYLYPGIKDPMLLPLVGMVLTAAIFVLMAMLFGISALVGPDWLIEIEAVAALPE